MPKYFLHPDGTPVVGPTPDADHADIARIVLRGHGVTAKDYEDLYVQMFRLGYARVVEKATEMEVELPGQQLSAAQEGFVKRAMESGKTVRLNGKPYPGPA